MASGRCAPSAKQQEVKLDSRDHKSREIRGESNFERDVALRSTCLPSASSTVRFPATEKAQTDVAKRRSGPTFCFVSRRPQPPLVLPPQQPRSSGSTAPRHLPSSARPKAAIGGHARAIAAFLGCALTRARACARFILSLPALCPPWPRAGVAPGRDPWDRRLARNVPRPGLAHTKHAPRTVDVRGSDGRQGVKLSL